MLDLSLQRKIYKTIKGGRPNQWSYLKEVWSSRHLILSFALRDLKVQYAQTYLGILWSVIQPLTALLIFTFFFQRVVPLQINVPYAAFAFTGILGWFYFTALVGQAGTVLMHNQQIIKKIQFPRLVLPLSKALVGMVEFGISLLILLTVLLVSGRSISDRIILLPVVVLANIITGLSFGIWLSALTIRFRDLHHIIPFLIGFGIWLTPVFYPTTIVPQSFNWIYYFHPVANVISLYRWIFLNMPIDMFQVIVSFFIALVMFVSGFMFFIKNEKFIADYL
jgi:lipopolysaccharide transport system permease protein